MTTTDEFADFVEHPRYGRRPRVTGLDPQTDYATGKVFLHWNASKEHRIPNTAIAADLTKQSPATVAVTHYFDIRRKCRDCGRPFIFFAEEQKYWYEELGFPLESDCVRCIDCRRTLQGLERKRERYEELFHAAQRTAAEDLEMAECCLSLIEGGLFHTRQLERVRMILKRLPAERASDTSQQSEDLWKRVLALEGRKAR